MTQEPYMSSFAANLGLRGGSKQGTGWPHSKACELLGELCMGLWTWK
jgi:hypothetical protein